MLNNTQFSNRLREWLQLNAKLIADKSLPERERAQLLHDREVYGAAFYAMEGTLYDK